MQILPDRATDCATRWSLSHWSWSWPGEPLAVLPISCGYRDLVGTDVACPRRSTAVDNDGGNISTLFPARWVMVCAPSAKATTRDRRYDSICVQALGAQCVIQLCPEVIDARDGRARRRSPASACC